MSNNHIEPSIWGPPTWHLIHQLAYNYDEKLKEHYKLFFEHFKYLIPCINCRHSFINNLNTYPLNLNNRESFIKWTILIHNIVNKKLRKRLMSIKLANEIYKNNINNGHVYNFISTFSTAYLQEHGNLIKCKELFRNLFKIYPDLSIRNKLIKITENDEQWNNLISSKILVKFILIILNK